MGIASGCAIAPTSCASPGRSRPRAPRRSRRRVRSPPPSAKPTATADAPLAVVSIAHALASRDRVVAIVAVVTAPATLLDSSGRRIVVQDAIGRDRGPSAQGRRRAGDRRAAPGRREGRAGVRRPPDRGDPGRATGERRRPRARHAPLEPGRGARVAARHGAAGGSRRSASSVSDGAPSSGSARRPSWSSGRPAPASRSRPSSRDGTPRSSGSSGGRIRPRPTDGSRSCRDGGPTCAWPRAAARPDRGARTGRRGTSAPARPARPGRRRPPRPRRPHPGRGPRPSRRVRRSDRPGRRPRDRAASRRVQARRRHGHGPGRLRGPAAELLPLIEIGDAINVTGRVEADGTGSVVVADDPGAVSLAGSRAADPPSGRADAAARDTPAPGSVGLRVAPIRGARAVPRGRRGERRGSRPRHRVVGRVAARDGPAPAASAATSRGPRGPPAGLVRGPLRPRRRDAPGAARG